MFSYFFVDGVISCLFFNIKVLKLNLLIIWFESFSNYYNVLLCKYLFTA